VIFEASEVRRLRARRKDVEIVTAGGVVRAESVIVAASASVADLRPLRRHLEPREGYAVATEPLPASVRRELGERSAAVRDWENPPHLLRWLKDDRAVIAGAEQPPAGSRAREQTLVQRTGQLMYELSLLYPAISGTQPEHGWAYRFDETLDGLPYIGAHRNFPHHLFALGLGRHGAAGAWLAARLFLRHLSGEPAKGDELFGFARVLHGH
jgi:glycine/D-amino acid oxidase-like deaminating enzyme